MTGEMSREEVTREAYPFHFMLADMVPGATVHPFDQYQGPYVSIPNRGSFWLVYDEGFCRWYDQTRHKASEVFREDDQKEAEAEARDLLAGGGFPCDDQGNVVVVTA